MSFEQILNTFLEESAAGKPLAIVGTTGVGKTDLAWKLASSVSEAKDTACVLLSVDSRQIYADIPILSGADIPPYAKSEIDEHGQRCFSLGKCRLYGVGVLDHDQVWSLGKFVQYARPIISAARLSGQLSILVGGTGLYYEHLFSEDPAIAVPPDEKLRERLHESSVGDLQKELGESDPHKLKSMNHSDRHNPRRLIRAIEISRAASMYSQNGRNPDEKYSDQLQPTYIGLTIPDGELRSRITRRVHNRFSGAKEEVSRLIDKQNLSPQIRSTLGFVQISAHLRGECSQDACVDRWIQAEWQYAKRQMTWWKKHQEISWFNAGTVV